MYMNVYDPSSSSMCMYSYLHSLIAFSPASTSISANELSKLGATNCRMHMYIRGRVE